MNLGSYFFRKNLVSFFSKNELKFIFSKNELEVIFKNLMFIFFTKVRHPSCLFALHNSVKLLTSDRQWYHGLRSSLQHHNLMHYNYWISRFDQKKKSLSERSSLSDSMVKARVILNSLKLWKFWLSSHQTACILFSISATIEVRFSRER